MHDSAHTMMSLFGGDKRAYGAYKLTGETSAGGKAEGMAYTLNDPVTVDLWDKHLVGKQGLGIIPINEESNVKFGAIDIDIYTLDLKKLAARLVEEKIPMVLCRTKSGGAHLYMFLNEYVPAKLVQRKLKEIASFLGYGQSEIFPKQTEILVDRGDMGQWINMPYFDGDKTLRYAIKDNKAIKLKQFIQHASEVTITLEILETLEFKAKEVLKNAPPCLQHLIANGFPKGTRNNGLMNLCVYAKKKDPDNWKALLEEYNQKFMDPPLPSTEVLGVVKSVDKKDYTYTCKQVPLSSYCDSKLCRTREFGVGTGTGLPAFGTLTKLNTIPPIWFLEVEDGGRLELTTEELQQPLKFQRKCMDFLNIMPEIVKRDIWHGIVQHLMKDLHVINVPKDLSPAGQLMEYLEQFCTSRAAGKTKDDLLIGKPWTWGGRSYFRMRDLKSYLDRMKFVEFKLNQIGKVIVDFGGQHHVANIHGKCVNYWSVPEFAEMVGELDSPEQSKEEPY